MNGIDWLAARIIAATTVDQRRKMREARFNPRPPGVIRPDSATEKVLAFLQQNQGRQFGRYQLILRTGRSESAVDWALLYLRTQGLITTHEDPTRNARYMRYSIAVKD